MRDNDSKVQSDFLGQHIEDDNETKHEGHRRSECSVADFSRTESVHFQQKQIGDGKEKYESGSDAEINNTEKPNLDRDPVGSVATTVLCSESI